MPSAGGATQSQMEEDKQNPQENNYTSSHRGEGIGKLTTNSGFYQCRPNTHNRPKRRRQELLVAETSSTPRNLDEGNKTLSLMNYSSRVQRSGHTTSSMKRAAHQ